MNSIAGFLLTLPPRPPADSQHGQQERETSANSQNGGGKGFADVLSGLGQNSAAGETASGTPAGTSTARTIEDANATNAAPAAAVAGASDSLAGAQAVAPFSALPNGVPAGSRMSTKAATGATSLANSNSQDQVPQAAASPGAIPDSPPGLAQQKGALIKAGPSVTLPLAASAAPNGAVASVQQPGGANLPSVTQLLLNSASAATPAAVSSQEQAAANQALNALFAAGKALSAETATPPTKGTADKAAASSSSSADASAAWNIANAAAIGASLQSVAAAQSLANAAAKNGRGEAAAQATPVSTAKSAGRGPASAVRPATGADAATASGAVADPTAQAAIAATAALNGGSQGGSLNFGAGSSPDLPLGAPLSAVVNRDAAAGLAGVSADSTSASSTIASTLGSVAADMNLTVQSSATHFAPVARLSPVNQIADAMIGALQGLSTSVAGSSAFGSPLVAGADGVASGAASSNSTAAPAQSAAGPVKVLNLQLEPPSMGTVTITLNLSDSGLDVQMAASQSSTVSLIEKDKNALSSRLQDSGYSVAGVAVTLGAHHGSNVANNGSATQGQAGQAPFQSGGQAMSQGGSSNGNGSAQKGTDRILQEPSGAALDIPAGAVAGGAHSGDLYI